MVRGEAILFILQTWDSKSLPDRSDKTKMLAYLRGLKAPNSMFSVYEEPRHQGLIQTLQSPETNAKNTAQDTDNNQDKRNVVVESSDTNKDNQVLWANPATQITILQPPEQESESDTCFWRGKEVNDQDYQLVQNLEKVDTDKAKSKDQKDKEKKIQKERKEKREKEKKKQDETKKNTAEDATKTASFGFEHMGESIIAFWECMKTKFRKSYARLQNKICSVF